MRAQVTSTGQLYGTIYQYCYVKIIYTQRRGLTRNIPPPNSIKHSNSCLGTLPVQLFFSTGHKKQRKANCYIDGSNRYSRELEQQTQSLADSKPAPQVGHLIRQKSHQFITKTAEFCTGYASSDSTRHCCARAIST